MAKRTQYRMMDTASMIAVAGMACLALAPQQVAAQTVSGEEVFVDLGRWTIFNRPNSRTCALRHRAPGGNRLVLTKSGSRPAVLTLEMARPNNFGGDIVFTFDEAEFVGRRQGNRIYTPEEASPEVENAFREARNLNLIQGGATVATVSLQYSSAGLRLLRQCAEVGRLGMAPEPEPEPAAAPAEDRPVLGLVRNTPAPERTPAPPPSLARDAAAIDPANWVGDTDSLRFPTRGWNGGILRFTLSVDPRGRAGECVVNRSTGSRNLDEQLCRRLIRRARFEPARDASGNPTAGSFSSSLRLTLPD